MATIDEGLKSFKVILDTSFAMEAGFRQFTERYAEAFVANPIIVPGAVVTELLRIARDADNRKRETAFGTMALLNRLAAQQRVEIRHGIGGDGRPVADIIESFVAQHWSKRDFLVLTNDPALMQAIQAALAKRPSEVRTSLLVARLQPQSSELEAFSPNANESAKFDMAELDASIERIVATAKAVSGPNAINGTPMDRKSPASELAKQMDELLHRARAELPPEAFPEAHRAVGTDAETARSKPLTGGPLSRLKRVLGGLWRFIGK